MRPETSLYAASEDAKGSIGQMAAMQGFMQQMAQLQQQLQAQQQASQSRKSRASGGHLKVDALCFQPPGAATPLLTDACLDLPANSLGLINGRSGSGKTTLLHLLAGLSKPTAGSISITSDGGGAEVETPASAAARCKTGIVFQFPERHFLAKTLLQELTLTWPQRVQDMPIRQELAIRLEHVLKRTGLRHLAMDTPLSQLSDGYKRRVALATQLARQPSLLLLDEPLAGVDWPTRASLASLLDELKKECTLLIVSHDLQELSPLADRMWRMHPGGHLQPSS